MLCPAMDQERYGWDLDGHTKDPAQGYDADENGPSDRKNNGGSKFSHNFSNAHF